jgi:CheY-like chemotaxis protein/Tfp pilus assembly protein PilF
MDLRGKYGLLIDDIAEMRTTVRIQLADSGLEKCDAARNIKEAIERLSQRRYDLIVCDYNLGQGADGQQLLELVRRRQLLPLTSAFLMITGETGYEQVSTAAEYAPDDYLIKPFTSELLRSRLERILEKKEALRPLYQVLTDKVDRAKALAICDILLGAKGRYALDILRHKGQLLLETKRNDEALALYQAVLDQRATPWAEVGKARALAATGNENEARQHLQRALEAYPNYLAAYDSLALLLEKTDKTAAQEVVEKALKVAPSTQRQRRLGGLALDNKDYPRAESAFRRAVEKDRTGFFKSHDDYAGLAKSCAEQGKIDDAFAAVKDMGNHFGRSSDLLARQAAVESLVHVKAGNPIAAKAALARALALNDDQALDPTTALEIATACFATGDEEKAKGIIQSVAEDHNENDAVMQLAQGVFLAAGHGEEGAVFLEATRKRMIKLNNDAVAMAKAGDLEHAIAMLTEAADRLTNNCQVSVNAALAILMDVQRNGAAPEKFARAQTYILQARRANPEHRQLPDLAKFYRKLAPPGTPIIDEA